MSRDQPGMASFLRIWAGQVVSILGSATSGFAIGVWVFEGTGSVTQFALIAFFQILPMLAVSPFAGALVDRWDRRRVMIGADTAAAACSLTLVLLLVSGRLELPWLYLLVAGIATGGAFQQPAFNASVPLLVGEGQLGRANGLAALGPALAHVLAPLLGGMLLAWIHLVGIVLLDLGSFLVAVTLVALARIPRPPRSAEAVAAEGALWREALAGWRYITARRGLTGLIALFAASNLALGMVQVLLTPMVLSFADERVLGAILSVGGVGMVAGGVTMAAWGGGRRRVPLIVALLAAQGVLLVVGGLRADPWLIGPAAFAFLFCHPLILASNNALWQRKVAPDFQGRVFAMQQVVGMSSLPVAYILAGPLADRVFNPLLVPGGALAASAGRVLGTGPGRGIGLLFVLLGVALVLTVAVAWSYVPLRRLERELPDAVGEDAAVAAAGEAPDVR